MDPTKPQQNEFDIERDDYLGYNLTNICQIELEETVEGKHWIEDYS